MKHRSTRGAALLILAAACSPHTEIEGIPVSPTLEDRDPKGALYNPNTQSFLRGFHWMDSVKSLSFSVDSHDVATLKFESDDPVGQLAIYGVKLDQLVPRLHYAPASPPDAFDAFNLMMAEYSRNGLSVPTGRSGDRMAHFESNLTDASPWKLAADYEFVPEKYYRPLRVDVVNNCLAPGLWELIGKDRAGELYHGWFEMPATAYVDLVARTNGLPADFVKKALPFSVEPVKLELDRLRRVEARVGETTIVAMDDEIGFSSQDSRRKLHKGFIKVGSDDALVVPKRLRELETAKVHMSSFEPPGKYSIVTRRIFDLAFLSAPKTVLVQKVRPLTRYEWRKGGTPHASSASHLELQLDLGDRVLVFGNLPMPLLVEQEDFVLHGFGVGILESTDFAERRELLFAEGPHPSFAYMAERRGDALYAINSHEQAVEQIFIRTHPSASEPYWEVTITSYERISDLVRYRIPIPEALVAETRRLNEAYLSPTYRTYKDDNIR